MEAKFTPMVPQFGNGQNQSYAPPVNQYTAQPPQSMYPPPVQNTSNTTVVINQPQASIGNAKLIAPLNGTRDWSTGIFGCFDDMANCIFTLFCFTCMECKNASRAGECFCLPFCVPAAPMIVRTKIRAVGGIRGSICNDCLIHSFCGPCATCQLSREMTSMGIP